MPLLYTGRGGSWGNGNFGGKIPSRDCETWLGKGECRKRTQKAKERSTSQRPKDMGAEAKSTGTGDGEKAVGDQREKLHQKAGESQRVHKQSNPGNLWVWGKMPF